MNRKQRVVVACASGLVAAMLFTMVPPRGHHVERRGPNAVRWDGACDSAFKAMAASAAETTVFSGIDRSGFPRDDADRDSVIARLGPRPDTRIVFVHQPDGRELLLRYLLPTVIVGLGAFALVGGPSSPKTRTDGGRT
jgi:hypothetical protein